MEYYVAPMEGITDDIYRNLHHRYYGGISKYFIPFISPTNQMSFTNRELRSVTRQHDAHFTCVPQVLTKDAETFVRTAQMLADMGYGEVNLNLGCPSGTVTGKGKGSSMLKDPGTLKSFFDHVFEACPVNVSVKTRIGFDDADRWNELCAVFNGYPFSEVIIHPRTRREFYKGSVHKDAFAEYYGMASQAPVFNGDLFTPEDIADIRAAFPCVQAVMLGRGIIAAPYLHTGLPDKAKLRSFHDALLHAYLDDRPANAALGHMAETMFYMSTVFDGSKKFLKLMQKARSADAYSQAADAMFETCQLRELPYFSPV